MQFRHDSLPRNRKHHSLSFQPIKSQFEELFSTEFANSFARNDKTMPEVYGHRTERFWNTHSKRSASECYFQVFYFAVGKDGCQMIRMLLGIVDDQFEHFWKSPPGLNGILN